MCGRALFPMMHRRGKFKLREMAEALKGEGAGGRAVAPGEQSESSGGGSERPARVQPSRDTAELRAGSGGSRLGPVGQTWSPVPGSVSAAEGPPGAGGAASSGGDGVNTRLEPVKGGACPGTAAGSLRETSPLQTDMPHPESATQQDSECRTLSAWQASCDDEEIARKAREEGHVDVVFPGTVTPDGCCGFVCELLKCVLYQRQQLPMTYDQMLFFQKQQHASIQSDDAAVKKSTKTSGGLNWHRCQRTLQELDDVLGNLEALFLLSHVPRVLFMLGGSTILPTELYEVNMEALVSGGGERTLRTSSCLRQLFRALFVADLLSDVKPVRLMATTVMALAHRDCGAAWFKPKVDFRVPTRVKKRVISLASDPSLSGQAAIRDLQDYIWFQAPVTVKGFCK